MDCFVGSVEEFNKRTPKREEKTKKRELRNRGVEESGKERTVVEYSLLRLKTLHRECSVDGTLAAVTQFERFLQLKRMAQKHRQSFDFINSIPLSLGCQLTKRLTYSWHLPLVAFSASDFGFVGGFKVWLRRN